MSQFDGRTPGPANGNCPLTVAAGISTSSAFRRPQVSRRASHKNTSTHAAHTRTRAHTHTHTHTQTQMQTQTQTRRQSHACAHAHAHTHHTPHAHTHTHTHPRMRTHTHTHTHTSISKGVRVNECVHVPGGCWPWPHFTVTSPGPYISPGGPPGTKSAEM
jgi:hypothetical protein